MVHYSPSDITIAIDGFAGCGKSTLARDLSTKLGYTFIDTGAMYRAITWYILQHQLTPNTDTAWSQLFDSLPFRFDRNDRYFQIYFDHTLLGAEIRTQEIAQNVSAIASVPAIRSWLVKKQQELGQGGGVVLDGRDIGTVVFPNAELKLFVTAQIEVRTERRLYDLQHLGISADYREIRQNLLERDEIDSHRADSPLQPAPDSLRLDTSRMTRAGQLEIVLEVVHQLQTLKRHPAFLPNNTGYA